MVAHARARMARNPDDRSAERRANLLPGIAPDRRRRKNEGMSRYDRRLQSLEVEGREALAIGWPVCNGDVLVGYMLQGKRVDRHDDESEKAFEHRVMAASIAKAT